MKVTVVHQYGTDLEQSKNQSDCENLVKNCLNLCRVRISRAGKDDIQRNTMQSELKEGTFLKLVTAITNK